VLIIHGTKDDVVPFWHGDELLRSFPPQCRAQPFWVEGLGHNHIETRRREEYITRINNFIQSYVLPNVALNVQHTLQEQNQQPRRYTKQPMVVQEWEQYKPETTLKQSGKFLVNQTWVKHGRDIVNDAIKERNGKPSSTNEHSSKTAKTKTNATSTATATIPNQKILKREESNTLSTLKLQTPTKLHRRSNSDAIRRASATSKQKSKSPEKSPQQKAIDLARMNTEDLLKMANKNRASSSLKTSGSNTSHAYKLSRSESNQSIESNASRYILTRESWTDDDDDLDVSFDEKENINRSNKETGVSIQTFQSAEKKESNAVVNKAGKNDYYFKSRSVDRYSVDDSVHL
jgi:dipeptidyl aminopeptidase/acylaminoacyl peptidase